MACIEAIRGNHEKAIEYLQSASKEEVFDPSWAWQDSDLDDLKDDPRFAGIAGPKPTPG